MNHYHLGHVVSVWISFVLVLLSSGAILAGSMVLMMARTLLRPARMTDAKAFVVLRRVLPGDLGLEFEDLKFVVRDESTGDSLKLAAWWIPCPGATRCALLLHGYADAKVGALAWAPMFHALGWNILAPDLRAHGHSGGVYNTAGFFERHDINQMINEIRAQRPQQTRQVVIFGVSLGAAVAAGVAAMRDDLAGIILESPFADFRNAVGAHGDMSGLPSGLLRRAAIGFAEKLSGADFHSIRPEKLIPDLKCPVMIIESGNDPFIPTDDMVLTHAALAAHDMKHDMLWTVNGAGHVLGLAADPAEYQRRVGAFLENVTA